TNEAKRLIRVLEKRLSDAAFLAGRDYSIADIATFPWVRSAVRGGGVSLDETPGVQRWLETIEARPAVERGMAVLADRRRQGPITDQAREILFGAQQHAKR
ncbi:MULTISPECIES: glutathione binding-like protein, partial [Streptomyces]